MGIIAGVILGVLAGAIAKAILPGDDPGGLIVTMVIGIIGGVIGGLIGEWVGFGGLGSFFELRTWVLAVAGSLLLLLVVRLAARGGRHRRSGVSYYVHRGCRCVERFCGASEPACVWFSRASVGGRVQAAPGGRSASDRLLRGLCYPGHAWSRCAVSDRRRARSCV
jgi:uncharacterized membrane protein YeaQ/YmgE (transglycosylase-associated protein family)